MKDLKPSRRAAVAPFMAMDVLRKAKKLEHSGRRIIHMELGEPGTRTPTLVRQAAERALGDGGVGYGEALGDVALRERIARHYAEHEGVDVSPDRIIVTTGSSGAFVMSFICGFDAGAKIGVFQPGYPAYANILEALGLSSVTIDLGEETGFAPTVELVEAAYRRERFSGLLLMSPANPTGVMIAPGELEQVCSFCDDAGILLISDEIYHRLEHIGRAETAARYSRNAIVINSFSKYYAMTGWRLGWIVAPPALTRPLERLQQSLAICAPALSQKAAIAAFDATDELEVIKAGYAKSRELLLTRLPRIGLPRFAPPDAAFYIYADIAHLTDDSVKFCEDVLEEAGVALTPGVDFDRARGSRTLRISYAGSPEDVAAGIERLGDWLSRSR